MRLKRLVVALAGLGLSGGALALTPLAVNNYLSNPNSCTNWIIGGAATYMEPLGNNFDYASTINQTASFINQGGLESPVGIVLNQPNAISSGVSQTEEEVNPDFGWGGMGIIDFRFPQTTNDVALTYMHFGDDNDDTTNNGGVGAFNAGSSQNVSNYTTTYGGVDPRGNILQANETGGVNEFLSNSDQLFRTVEGEVDSDFDQVNLMFGHTFNDGRLGIRIAGGAQYARIESDETVTASNPVFIQNYSNNVPSPSSSVGNINERNVSDSQFNGIGPRVGIGATFDLGSGFNLYADSGLELLVGDTDTLASSTASGSYSTVANGVTTNTTNVNQGAILTPGDSTTVVPGGDVEAGIAYTAPVAQNVNITGQLGYMVAGYVHPINHVFASESTVSQDNWTDFGTHGAYLGLDVSFG